MPKTVAVGAASPMSVRLTFGRMLMMYDIGNRTKNDCANPCAMTNAERHAYDEHVNAIMIQNDVLGNARLEGMEEGRA